MVHLRDVEMGSVKLYPGDVLLFLILLILFSVVIP
jgi:hypothetical protein